MIDTAFQGQDIGTGIFAVLHDYFLEHHAEFSELNPTVNVEPFRLT